MSSANAERGRAGRISQCIAAARLHCCHSIQQCLGLLARPDRAFRLRFERRPGAMRASFRENLGESRASKLRTVGLKAGGALFPDGYGAPGWHGRGRPRGRSRAPRQALGSGGAGKRRHRAATEAAEGERGPPAGDVGGSRCLVRARQAMPRSYLC
jgi:hypothetical protein